MRPVTIVALGKYNDIWKSFDQNVSEFASGHDQVFVRDGHLIPEPRNWKVVQGPKVFCMAGNANLGWKAADPNSDLLYLGDDVRFTQHGSIEKLSELAYSDSAIGMLSPKILGGADNQLQKTPPEDLDLSYSDRYLALVCTFIKRETIDKVGYLDEVTFAGCYGNDDADYSRRVRLAGYRLAVTPRVAVQHGLDHNGTETFLRNIGGYSADMETMIAEHDKRYLEKWGDLQK